MQSRLSLERVDSHLRVAKLSVQLQMFFRQFRLPVASIGLTQEVLHVGINGTQPAALFERLDRLDQAATLLGAMSQQESSFHHVPELTELEGRLAATLGEERTRELIAAGSAFDLNDAAVYARQQIDAARRDPVLRVRQARPGGLSRREVEVLRLLAGGRTSGEIATELFISTRTAEHHISNIYTKIGVPNRAAATRWAVVNRVVDGALAGNG